MKQYFLRTGCLNAVGALSILVASLFAFPRERNRVVWGPDESIVFGGFVIDTWPRWAVVMAYSVLSQASICINVNTLEPFVNNVVKDHKTLDKPAYSQAVVALKTSYDWVVGIFNTNLWVTLQVQFLAVALATDLLANAYMTRRVLRLVHAPELHEIMIRP